MNVAKPGRVYLPVDVTFLDEHRGISPAAVALWLEGALYAKAYLTDGLVSRSLVGRRTRAATELVKLGLWHPEPGDHGPYRIHAWEAWHKSAEAVRAHREADRIRKARERSR